MVLSGYSIGNDSKQITTQHAGSGEVSGIVNIRRMREYAAGPRRQPRLESPKMLDARELSFIAMLDDVHEQNFTR